MAAIDLALQTVQVVLDSTGDPSSLSVPLLDSTGANVTLTTPVFSAGIYPQQYAAESAFGVGMTVGLISNAAGKAVLSVALEAATLPAGSYGISLWVTPSGGTQQLVAQGNAQVK